MLPKICKVIHLFLVILRGMGSEDSCKILHQQFKREFMTCHELNMIVGELDHIYDGDSDEASCNDGHKETCVWIIRLSSHCAVIDLV